MGSKKRVNEQRSTKVKEFCAGFVETGRLRATLRVFTSCLVAVAFVGGCATGNVAVEGDHDARCEQIVEQLIRCYPDLAGQATCSPETIELYETYDVGNFECATLDDMGKADFVSGKECEEGKHVCWFFFCCDNYTISKQPTALDWDILDLVDVFQDEMPDWVAEDRQTLTEHELLAGVSWTWRQEVVEISGGSPVRMAVHLSERTIDVPYENFVQRMPPEKWGVNLAYYIGGEVAVVETDVFGRATHQIERMVLSPLSYDMDFRLGNNDMTKAEIIVYGEDWAKVYWRVYYSDNNSTEADVGSVEFRAHGADATRVTFHSAHRLNDPFGIHIPSRLVMIVLKTYFLEHIQKYKTIVK